MKAIGDSEPHRRRLRRLKNGLIRASLAAAVLALTGAAAAASYRTRLLSQFEALRDSVARTHPDLRRIEHIRFGVEAPDLAPSFFEDLLQGLRRGIGLGSRLDFDWMESHAYHLVVFKCEREGSFRHHGHTFIWSPRKLSFVFFGNWNWGEGCAVENCSWLHDPPPWPCDRCQGILGNYRFKGCLSRTAAP